MRRVSWIFIVGLCNAAYAADETVISDDGRQIRLKGDGTWVQLSQDRYATNAAGQRIRLRPDGTWNVMSHARVQAEAGDTSGRERHQQQALVDEPVLYLGQVEILKRSIRRSKSTHADKRMRFVVEVDNRSQQTLHIPNDLERLVGVLDNRGGVYTVTSVRVDTSEIAAGNRGKVYVETKDAPQWFGLKYLTVKVDAGGLGNEQPRLLNKRMDEVVRREVDSF